MRCMKTLINVMKICKRKKTNVKQISKLLLKEKTNSRFKSTTLTLTIRIKLIQIIRRDKKIWMGKVIWIWIRTSIKLETKNPNIKNLRLKIIRKTLIGAKTCSLSQGPLLLKISETYSLLWWTSPKHNSVFVMLKTMWESFGINVSNWHPLAISLTRKLIGPDKN